MKSKELYEAKLREDPMARAPATAKPRPSVHAAMAMRSPVISTLFPTPLVRIRVRNPNPNPKPIPNPNLRHGEGSCLPVHGHVLAAGRGGRRAL